MNKKRIKNRKVSNIWQSQVTMEGAGVRLKRAFGNAQAPQLDPFLLLDDFHSDDPDDYIAGFPWHPHRGIETVTYMLHGRVTHEDSLNNKGVIESGDVQWMTAGSGIIHSEMPQQDSGLLRGLQLWVNLPGEYKMMNPRYRDIHSSRIPEVSLDGGVTARVISGEAAGIKGPVRDIVVDPLYMDVTVPAGSVFSHPVKDGYTTFAYVLEGSGYFDNKKNKLIEDHHLAIFEDSGYLEITGGEAADGVRFLLVAGKPINEPVAWYGPIVMNTREELQAAFDEYQKGTFIKYTG